MRFLIAVIDNQSNTGTEDEMHQINAFNDMLQEKGHWIIAAGLETAKIVVTADGSYMSGFWIIEAESREQAQALAEQGSVACNRRVELRPFL